jgi:hypothetical protein
MSTTDYAAENRHRSAVANTILEQIGRPALWTIGAHDYTIPAEGGLSFKARILPFKADGRRSDSPRNMDVTVTLNGMDLYEVKVTHRRGAKVTTHYESETGVWGMDFTQLRATIHALDSDGPEARDMNIYFRHA